MLPVDELNVGVFSVEEGVFILSLIDGDFFAVGDEGITSSFADSGFFFTKEVALGVTDFRITLGVVVVENDFGVLGTDADLGVEEMFL